MNIKECLDSAAEAPWPAKKTFIFQSKFRKADNGKKNGIGQKY